MPPAESFSIGRTLAGRYRLAEKLGNGGMATVYRAWDYTADGDVVVKVPHGVLLLDREFAERFRREAGSLARLKHPQIVPLLEFGNEDGFPFLILPYLCGGNLCQRRDVAGLDWLEGIALALDFVHANGYVHRDVKPSNILFDDAGRAYLGDFGIAKALATHARCDGSLTASGSVIGTPEYMAPEVLTGKPYDGRADQFALAVTVFESVTGQRPFQGETAAAVALAQSTAVPHCVNLPSRLAPVLWRALSIDPGARFRSCREFGDALRSSGIPSQTVRKPRATAERNYTTALSRLGRRVADYSMLWTALVALAALVLFLSRLDSSSPNVSPMAPAVLNVEATASVSASAGSEPLPGEDQAGERPVTESAVGTSERMPHDTVGAPENEGLSELSRRPDLLRHQVQLAKKDDANDAFIRGDYDLAIDRLSEALALDPSDADTYFRRAEAKFERAESRYLSYIKQNASNLEERLRSEQGFTHLKMSEEADAQWSEAVEDYTEALKLDPTFIAAYLGRAAAYREMFRPDDAFADLDAALLKGADRANLHLERAKTYSRINDPRRAISEATIAIQLDPESADAWSTRGDAYFHAERFAIAIEDFTKAIRLEPDNGSHYFWRALAFGALNRIPEANADAAKAERLGH